MIIQCKLFLFSELGLEEETDDDTAKVAELEDEISRLQRGTEQLESERNTFTNQMKERQNQIVEIQEELDQFLQAAEKDGHGMESFSKEVNHSWSLSHQVIQKQ